MAPWSDHDALYLRWISQNDGTLEFVPENGAKSKGGFITRTQIRVAGPCIAKLSLKSTTAGQAAIAWRMEGEKDFATSNREPFPIQSSDEWQSYEVQLPSPGTVIHIRIHFPHGPSTHHAAMYSLVSRVVGTNVGKFSVVRRKLLFDLTRVSP